MLEAKHVSWCIIDINGKYIKAAVEPNDRGKFRVLWIENKYKYLINKYIDASSIIRVMLKDAPDYCPDDFRI